MSGPRRTNTLLRRNILPRQRVPATNLLLFISCFVFSLRQKKEEIGHQPPAVTLAGDANRETSLQQQREADSIRHGLEVAEHLPETKVPPAKLT